MFHESRNSGTNVHTFAPMTVCNGTTRAEQKRSTDNAEPNEGCTNKLGNVWAAWSVIVT